MPFKFSPGHCGEGDCGCEGGSLTCRGCGILKNTPTLNGRFSVAVPGYPTDSPFFTLDQTAPDSCVWEGCYTDDPLASMSVTGVWMRVDLSGAAPVFTVRWYTDGHGCFSGPYWETSSATDMTLADFDCVENPDFPEFSSFAVQSGTFTTTYLPDWYNARFLVGGGGVPGEGFRSFGAST